MLIVILFLLVLTTLLCLLAIFLSRLDSDLTLYFADKLGKSPAVLRGKVIWITGASSGIGRALAKELAQYGCKLIISASNAAKLVEAKTECIEKGVPPEDILDIPFDLKDFDVHSEAVQKALSHFKQINILVNNAGRSQRANFCDVDWKVDEEILKINTLAPVNLTRLLVKNWEKRNQQGQVVVVTSVAGKSGVPFSCSYTGSKHALHGYFECLRIECARSNISVTMVCPGPVESSILQNAYTEKLGNRVEKAHPQTMKRQSAERCAHLIAVSTANELDEAWISIQPVLTLMYLYQYFPSLCRSLFAYLFTPEKFQKLRDGDVKTS